MSSMFPSYDMMGADNGGEEVTTNLAVGASVGGGPGSVDDPLVVATLASSGLASGTTANEGNNGPTTDHPITPAPATNNSNSNDNDNNDFEDLNDEPLQTFPQKLMEMLNDSSNTVAITWLPHGRAFIIYKKKSFAEEVLPKYFKSCKYTSFTRKLNRWGFTRITRGPEMGSYFHPKFLRDDPSQCLQMCSNSGGANVTKFSPMMYGQPVMGVPSNPTAAMFPMAATSMWGFPPAGMYPFGMQMPLAPNPATAQGQQPGAAATQQQQQPMDANAAFMMQQQQMAMMQHMQQQFQMQQFQLQQQQQQPPPQQQQAQATPPETINSAPPPTQVQFPQAHHPTMSQSTTQAAYHPATQALQQPSNNTIQHQPSNDVNRTSRSTSAATVIVPSPSSSVSDLSNSNHNTDKEVEASHDHNNNGSSYTGHPHHHHRSSNSDSHNNADALVWPQQMQNPLQQQPEHAQLPQEQSHSYPPQQQQQQHHYRQQHPGVTDVSVLHQQLQIPTQQQHPSPPIQQPIHHGGQQQQLQPLSH